MHVSRPARFNFLKVGCAALAASGGFRPPRGRLDVVVSVASNTRATQCLACQFPFPVEFAVADRIFAVEGFAGVVRPECGGGSRLA